MADEEYYLMCSIPAHVSDIRAVTASYVPLGGIITGSRDKTIKLWNPAGTGFTEEHCMRGATHFISSLCALPPSDQYPDGLILAGSNDCAIYGFSFDSAEPILKLLGHSENVCALVAGNLGTIVSGSWDKTARVWHGQRCVATLSGHTQAVWAVALLPDHALVLTGSADKAVFLWNNGKCERKFIGHEDCVRGLAVISDVEFLSCSNDTTVRRWQTSGECLGIYAGHTDYVYDICLSSCREYFISCSEDQTVKVWKENTCVQTINLPAKSLWAVAYLYNGDIAVGGSDGTLRVFTKDKSRRASPAEEARFNEEIISVNSKNMKQNIGDLELDDVPGPEVLLQDGTSDGQTKLCKVGTEVSVYQWSVKEHRWMKLGQVLDAMDNTPPKGKTAYEGKEYDYVFTIDVAEGKLLKLPYNDTDDPWLVAHKFIEKHDLNPLFLDQIANFIINNSKSAGVQTESIPEFSDPFTGGSRYIPSDVGKSHPMATNHGDNGNIQMLPKDNPTGNGDIEKIPTGAHFPLLTYITFDNANTNGIKAKLCEFTEKVEKSQQLSLEKIECMLLLLDYPSTVTDDQMLSLEKALGWPAEFVFPALDVLRMAVRAEPVNSRVSKDGGVGLINHLLRYASGGNPVSNQMLVLRTLSNFFVHPSGEQLLVEQAKKVLSLTRSFCASKNKHVQIALSTLYANYSVAFQKSTSPDDTYCKDMYLNDAVEALKQFNEPEALFRLIVCIGTAVQDKYCLQVAKALKVGEIIKSVLERSNVSKIQDFGATLINIISN